MSTIQDTDLLLVNRGGTDYNVTAEDLNDYFNPKMPWEGHDGGIWHITNLTGGQLNLQNSPYTAWDVDGTNERQISTVAVGEELVFVTGNDCNDLFYGNSVATWDFGEITDTSKVTEIHAMFEGCTAFNGKLGGNWDTSNMTSMDGMQRMFSYASAFNQDIGNWDVSNVKSMHSMFDGASSFNQDLSGWCVSKLDSNDSKPFRFDKDSGFEGQTAKQPQWGTCP